MKNGSFIKKILSNMYYENFNEKACQSITFFIKATKEFIDFDSLEPELKISV
jgi:hypothetical protein